MSTTFYRIETQEEADRITKEVGEPYKIGDEIRLYPMEKGRLDGIRIIQSHAKVVNFVEIARAKRLAHSKAVEDAWCIATMAGKKFVAPK